MLPTTAAASPVASCTPAVSSALSAGPGATAIHVNADSPTSPDKARKGKSVTLRVPIPSSPPLISTYLIDSSLSLSLSLSFDREASVDASGSILSRFA